MKFNVPCPACKKPVANDAATCPHCGQVFDAKALQARKNFVQVAGVGCGVLLAIVLVLAVLGMIFGDDTPQPDTSKPEEAAKVASAEAKPEEAHKAAEADVADAQFRVLTFVRGIRMQAISCSGDVDYAQGQIDKVASGKAALVEAYEAVGSAEKACRAALEEFPQFDPAQFTDPKATPTVKDAIAACTKGAEKRRAAMAEAKSYLNKGTATLEQAAQYRAKVRDAKNDDAICNLNLKGFAAQLGVPESDLDFLD